MSPFIESLKRLTIAKKLTMAQVENLVTNGMITQEEYEYINPPVKQVGDTHDS